MANHLTMPKKQQILALLALGWTYRRIETETGVRRETVSRYDAAQRANAAKVFPGADATAPSDPADSGDPASRDPPNAAKVFPGTAPNPAKVFAGPPRARAAAYRTAILEKLDAKLSVQRIWQDLVEEYGYGASYESVKRYVRAVQPTARPVGVYLCAPGDEGQIDFFRGAPTLDTTTGEWKRPWVFRVTLGCSRHGYEEAVWDQQLETFLRVQERAFFDLGGVPRVIRVDNQKVAVLRACFFDPDVHPVYAAFAAHWGFTPLPIQPHRPQENGKQERSGGYVKSNALAGHRFDSLAAHNAHLQHWNRTVARVRIHGTTRRQVWTHFVEVEQPALQPLPSTTFALFTHGTRTVHPDGHIEIGGAFYPVPAECLGRAVRARWDAALVRVFDGDTLVAVHARVRAGLYAPAPGQASTEPTTRQRAYLERLLGRCGQVGPPLRQWAEAAVAARGVRAVRLIQGVLGLARQHPRERLVHAATVALAHQRFRYKELARLATGTSPAPSPRPLISDDPAVRPMSAYTLELFR